MIKSYKNKHLKELVETGKSHHIGDRYLEKCLIILTLLQEAESLDDLNIPSFRFHRLETNPVRYSMRVNKNYRITFGWDGSPVTVDFEDYH